MAASVERESKRWELWFNRQTDRHLSSRPGPNLLRLLSGDVQLAHEGYYLSTGRQSAFYYVLTGLHGIHVLGGILALTWLMFHPRPHLRLEVTAVYWHFMSVLWLYLLVVFFI